jgi:anti-anti-sigma factor
MEIQHRAGGVTVLNVVGRLVTGSTPSLRALVSELVANRHVVVLIDLAAVTDMDAHGIGELVSSATIVERHGGHIALIAPAPCAAQLLAATCLDTVFTIYDSRLEALVKTCPAAVAAALSRNGFDQQVALQQYFC